ncbi:MAG: AAA family ATPase [Candidatus Diapherotrites archaeon]
MIRKVLLENWRSHKHTELEFGPGTNVLVGQMGSGKSSVMSAICFALFGTFPEAQRRETKIEEAIMDRPSKMDEACVSLEFDYRGKNYTVERKVYRDQKTNTAKLYENDSFLAGPKVSEVNERIEHILEINYELFSRAVYSEQNQVDFFIRMNAGERKQKFDELLELDRYEKVRKNAVNVANTLKKVAEEKKKFLEEQGKGAGKSELDAICAEIRQAEERIKARLEEKGRVEKELAEMEKAAKALSEKRKKFASLNEKTISLRQEIESIERELKRIEKDTGVALDGVKEGELKGKPEEIRAKVKQLKEQEKEIGRIEAEIGALKAKKEALEEENSAAVKSLPPKIRSKEDLLKELLELGKKKEELEKKEKEKKHVLSEIEKQEKELGEEVGILESNQGDGLENLEKIKSEEAECPLCKRPLSGEARQGLIERTEALLEGLGADRKKLHEKLHSLKAERKKAEEELEKAGEELKSLAELRSFLESLRRPLERIRENIERLGAIDAQLVVFEKKGKDLKAERVEEELEQCAERLDKVEKIIEGIERKKERTAKSAELKDAEKALLELGFDEAKAMETERKLGEKSRELESFEMEVKGLKELAEEKKKRESEIRAKIGLVENARKSLEGTEFGISKLAVFVNALKAAQAELRESLVETVNEAMEIVWKRIYPYGDYVSAKMEISEGDYELKVLARNGKWGKIEGILSGGERSSVALTLRIAFSLVLARNLGILILDEPTHNLDENAVSKLAEMMHGRIEGLVEQVFLITHSKEMEKAASASLYLLERNKEEEGITRAELLEPLQE